MHASAYTLRVDPGLQRQSLSPSLSLCWLRAARYPVLFPLFYSSHILSLIMRTSDKNAASRLSGEGESFPAFLPLSFYFITAATSLLLSLPPPPPSLHLAHSNKHNHAHQSLQKKITSSFVIITLSVLQLQSVSLHFIFSCDLSCRRR